MVKSVHDKWPKRSVSFLPHRKKKFAPFAETPLRLFTPTIKINAKTSKTAEKSIMIHCVDRGLCRPVYRNVLHGFIADNRRRTFPVSDG